MFQNPEIALADLPGTEDVTWQTLDAAYKRLRQLENLILVVIIAVPVGILTTINPVPIIPRLVLWAVGIIVAALLFLWPGIALPKRGYVVRDKDILFRKGVVWQSVTAIPFNRIQHVEISSTPFDRKFNLAQLQLFTAGGSSGDLKIDGLNSAVAEQLRLFVLEKAGATVEHR